MFKREGIKMDQLEIMLKKIAPFIIKKKKKNGDSFMGIR